MKVDVYDTYATDPNGRLLHFEFYVPAGTSAFEVERLAHLHVGGMDPEIEAECVRKNVLANNRTAMNVLVVRGFSVQPLLCPKNRAA